MSVLFVSHDLGVVRYVCDRVAVVYGGQIVEIGRIDDVVGGRGTGSARLAASPAMPKDDDFESFIGQRLQTIDGFVPAVRRFPADVVSATVARTRRPRAPRSSAGRQTVTATAFAAGTRRRRADRRAIVEVDDIYFHYPRPVVGSGDEGWTLRGSRSRWRRLDARHRRRVRLGEVDVDPGHVRTAPSPAARFGSTTVTSGSSGATTRSNCVGGTRSCSRTLPARSPG